VFILNLIRQCRIVPARLRRPPAKNGPALVNAAFKRTAMPIHRV
jgi:hypothetical protein